VNNEDWDIITVVGPTASGKTELAVALADKLGSEVISADSRQVYRRMDIGTGKDLVAYQVDGRPTGYHLIDICEPGQKYNVFAYQRDFFQVYEKLHTAGKLPVLCGGTGMYIEAVLRGYRLWDVPENTELRRSLEGKSLTELSEILSQYKGLHNKTDTDTVRRAIRAIEIAAYHRQETPSHTGYPALRSLVFGLHIDRDLRRKSISRRLHSRLDEGMLDEVRRLLAEGLSPDDLIYYGLEYKYLTLHLIGRLSYDDMVKQLETAIHQFAKRQMTWFRGMERRGIPIHWIEATLPLSESSPSRVFTYLCCPNEKRGKVYRRIELVRGEHADGGVRTSTHGLFSVSSCRYPVGTMYRQTGEHCHAGAICSFPHSSIARFGLSRRGVSVYPHRFLSE
jgi:tRNA dimethylallyltransferase